MTLKVNTLPRWKREIYVSFSYTYTYSLTHTQAAKQRVENQNQGSELPIQDIKVWDYWKTTFYFHADFSFMPIRYPASIFAISPLYVYTTSGKL